MCWRVAKTKKICLCAYVKEGVEEAYRQLMFGELLERFSRWSQLLPHFLDALTVVRPQHVAPLFPSLTSSISPMCVCLFCLCSQPTGFS